MSKENINFYPKEKFYRAIKQDKPQMWKTLETGEIVPSSAVFKDSNGVSVDRQKNRNNDEAVNYIRRSFEESDIISVKVEDCTDIGVRYKSEPLNTNEYHCLIIGKHKIPLTSSEAKKLAMKAKMEFKH